MRLRDILFARLSDARAPMRALRTRQRSAIARARAIARGESDGKKKKTPFCRKSAGAK